MFVVKSLRRSDNSDVSYNGPFATLNDAMSWGRKWVGDWFWYEVITKDEWENTTSLQPAETNSHS